jgi:Flp pilus assembly protein TadB
MRLAVRVTIFGVLWVLVAVGVWAAVWGVYVWKGVKPLVGAVLLICVARLIDFLWRRYTGRQER